jgi:drug/metabolite transporter (DMT)-like permease
MSFAIVIFGLNASVARVIMSAGITPIELSFFRAAGTTVVAALALLVIERSGFRVTRKQLGGLALIGIFGVALIQVAYAVAVKNLPVGIALLFEYSGIILVALFAFFVFRERMKHRLWFALAAVVVGLAIVANVWSVQLNPVGVIAGVLAAVFLAAYFLMSERMLHHASVLKVSFWTMLAASLIWLVPAAPWNFELSTFSSSISLGGTLEQISVPLWMPLVWVSVVGTFGAYVLSFLGIKYLRATPAGVLSTGEVLFAFLFGWLWLGETLQPVQILGVVFVIVGILVAQTARKGHPVDLNLATSELELPRLKELPQPQAAPLPKTPQP